MCSLKDTRQLNCPTESRFARDTICLPKCFSCLPMLSHCPNVPAIRYCSKKENKLLGGTYPCLSISKDDWDKCSMRVCADVTYTDTGVWPNSVTRSQVFFLTSHILSTWVKYWSLVCSIQCKQAKWKSHIIIAWGKITYSMIEKWALQICLKTHQRLTGWVRGNPSWPWYRLALSSLSWKNYVLATLLPLLRCD